MRLTARGFTLVEIMIVVAILGLIASIAIPALLRARLNANESAMKGEIRTFSSANESFRSQQNPSVYAGSLNELMVPPSGPAFLDGTWVNPTRHGYNVAYASGGTTYTLLTIPITQGITANNTFCVDQTAVIVGSTADGAANAPTAGAAGCVGGVAIP